MIDSENTDCYNLYRYAKSWFLSEIAPIRDNNEGGHYHEHNQSDRTGINELYICSQDLKYTFSSPAGAGNDGF